MKSGKNNMIDSKIILFFPLIIMLFNCHPASTDFRTIHSRIWAIRNSGLPDFYIEPSAYQMPRTSGLFKQDFCQSIISDSLLPLLLIIFLLRFLGFFKIQHHTIYTITKACWWRAIFKNVTQMSFTPTTLCFRALHS